MFAARQGFIYAATPAAAPPPSGGDPYWNDVYIYLDGETIADTSDFAHSVTNTGVTTSTTQVKYGTSSLYFDGSSKLEVVGTDLGADTGDWTADMWVYLTSRSGYNYFYETRTSGPTTGAMLVTSDPGGGIGSYVDSGYWLFENQGTINLNTWHHVAFSRSGSTTKAFIDGTEVASVSDAINYNQDGFHVGGNFNGTAGFFVGYIDSLRWTKAARYTANFTPPTASDYGP